LASVPPRIYNSLQPHLRLVQLQQGTVLFRRGDIIDPVYFPCNGIISLVVELTRGPTIETAMIGRDSLCGGASALNAGISLNTSIVQLAGDGVTLDVDQFRGVAEKSPQFRAIVVHHEQALLAQTQQSAACNVSHQLEARLSRWLLRARDLSGSDSITKTQECLAQMLGVQVLPSLLTPARRVARSASPREAAAVRAVQITCKATDDPDRQTFTDPEGELRFEGDATVDRNNELDECACRAN
jgi:CRP-like cAMP-binding protein